MRYYIICKMYFRYYYREHARAQREREGVEEEESY